MIARVDVPHLVVFSLLWILMPAIVAFSETDLNLVEKKKVVLSLSLSGI